MTTQTHLQSRFKLLPKPVAAPGKCAICGVPNKPVIDFGLSVEFYGAVYYCVSCIIEAAMVTGEVVDAVRYELLQTQLTTVTENLDEALSHIKAFDDEQRERVSRLTSNIALIISGYGARDLEDSSESESTSEGSVEVTGQVPDTVEQQRPDDIPSNSSNGSDTFQL